MANQAEIEAHYDTIGTLHALRLRATHDGFPDYTCAFFDGDLSKNLKQAQEDKHAWIFEGLGLEQDLTGKRILDIGCGWGPMLNAVRKRGGEAVGLTLSSAQQRYCAENGFDARLMDHKDLKKGQIGIFDGIVSVGSAEAYCSVREFLAGTQGDVYQNFFRICAENLVPHGRLYLQTMLWGKKVPDHSKLSLDAETHSEEAILARLEKFYPGSWLPSRLGQLITAAEPHFNFLKTSNGRIDYIETLKRWSASSKNLLIPDLFPQTVKAGVPLLVKALTDKDTRTQLKAIYYGDQRECFKREIMTHERMFFEKAG